MKELSLNILDIVKNSVTAGAKNIAVTLTEEGDTLEFSVSDDGCGMTKEFVRQVTDPFTTTRTTRKVGMGIPLLKMVAEMTGGSLTIDSEVGVGTTLRARFRRGHIDLPPMGDLPSTVMTLIQGSPDIDFIFCHSVDGAAYTLDTRELRAVMEGIPLDSPELLSWISDFIAENEKELNA